MRWSPDRRIAVVAVSVIAATGVLAPRFAASGRADVRADVRGEARVGGARAAARPAAPASTLPSSTTVPVPSAPDRLAPDRLAPDRLASSAATTAFTAPGLGVPEPKPAARTVMRLVALGRLRIPAIGLDQVMHEGIAQNVIDAGPAHWPGTAAPGQAGNVVVAGHRSSHTAPFRRIAELHTGDRIEFVRPDGRVAIYSVYEQFVVPVTGRWITGQAIDPRTVPATARGRDVGGHPAIVTIFTCHPIGSARERLVTRAVLVGGG